MSIQYSEATTLRICDCHTHVGHFYDHMSGRFVSYSPETLLSEMDAAGVDLAVVSNISAMEDPEGANDEMSAWARRYPRLIPLVWATPGITRPEKVLEYLGMGFRGVKLHPTAGKYRADCSTVRPVLDVCRVTQAPALFHCAADEFSAPALLGQVAADYPEAPIILAHMNMFGSARDAIAVAEGFPNVYLDTSWARPERVVEAVRRVGADRVLWGTDAPLGGTGHYRRDRAREYLEEHVGAMECEAVMWSNAACLFCLE